MQPWINERNEQIATQYKNFCWENKTLYANYLAQTYYFVSHSTRLLATSAGRMDNDHEQLFRRFTKHITEEQSHERLAERDLRTLGYEPKDFKELGITKAFYQSQYFLIEHVTPYALLGYILMLETLGVKGCAHAYQRVEKTFGARAGSFLKVHAEEDPSHVEKAFQAINSLSASTQEIIWDSFEQTHQNYSTLLNRISEPDTHYPTRFSTMTQEQTHTIN